MSTRTLVVRAQLTSQTCTIKAGRYQETFTYSHLPDDSIVDQARWIAITGGVSANRDTLVQLLRAAGVLSQ